MESMLVNFSNELASIVEATGKNVVSVRARRHYPSSGILWAPGVIVTANHTVQRDEDISVTLAGGKTVSATLAGRDPGNDLAALRLASPQESPAHLARETQVKAGELAFVVGRSPESGVNASAGIVSAASGPWRTWRGGRSDAYLRLDAHMFPQSAGGAVINAGGKIIGMATPVLSRIAGLAVPVSTIASVTEKLLERGFLPRGYLGVGVQPVPFSEELRKRLAISNRSGLIVLTVEPNGPADKAGVLIGDILTGIDDAAIEHPEDLRKYTDSAAIGKTVKINLIRGGAVQHSTLTVGERPTATRPN